MATAAAGPDGTVWSMSYSTDRRALLEPVFNTPGKRGPKHAPDLRRVIDAMLDISSPNAKWRILPGSSTRLIRSLPHADWRWYDFF